MGLIADHRAAQARYERITTERQELHDALYTGAMDPDLIDSRRDDLADEAWTLLDRLADMLGIDPRPLDATDPTTRQETTA